MSASRQLQQPSIQLYEAHYALAKLEQYLERTFPLVTQNIDHLREKQGVNIFSICMASYWKVRCP